MAITPSSPSKIVIIRQVDSEERPLPVCTFDVRKSRRKAAKVLAVGPGRVGGTTATASPWASGDHVIFRPLQWHRSPSTTAAFVCARSGELSSAEVGVDASA